MFDVAIIAVGRMKNSAFRAAAGEYAKRLAPFAKLIVREIEAVPFRSEADKKKSSEREAEKIRALLGRLKEGSEIFLLDERGKGFFSGEFACFLGARKGGVVFVIGGALGFSAAMKKEFPSVSLSPLTMPHELARVVLLEQIYRAVAIINGKEYHY